MDNISKFRLRVLLGFCLIFFQLEPGVTYENAAYKKVYNTKKCDYLKGCVSVPCLEATKNRYSKNWTISVVKLILKNCNFIEDGLHRRRFLTNILKVFISNSCILHFKLLLTPFGKSTHRTGHSLFSFDLLQYS